MKQVSEYGIILCSLIIIQSLDIITTQFIIGHGGFEANMFLAERLDHIWLIKAIGIILIMGLVVTVDKLSTAKPLDINGSIWVGICACAITATAVVSNTIQIIYAYGVGVI